jgi:meso-butanediol dehydrogenase / (S,S)-butanediol dehydrogenase / diacetyl reductase
MYNLNMDKPEIAVITGSDGGIGNGITKWLEDSGVLCLKIIKSGKNEEGNLVCDLSDQNNVQELVKKISLKYHHIDYLFNVAGIGVYKNIEELNTEEWNSSIAINLTAPFLLIKGLLPLLKRAKRGTVINIGSKMGTVATPGRVAYCTSKFALRGMSLTLSEELKKDGISVVHLTLGSVMTGFGTGGIEKRKQLEKSGKKYLSVDEVIQKISDVISSPVRKPEYVMYP